MNDNGKTMERDPSSLFRSGVWSILKAWAENNTIRL